MSDVEDPAPAAAPPAAAKKAKKKKSKKGPQNHPKYSIMIKETLIALKERGGSSRQAILKYILANYNVDKDEKVSNQHLKMSLRAGIKNGMLTQTKGAGAAGTLSVDIQSLGPSGCNIVQEILVFMGGSRKLCYWHTVVTFQNVGI